ncbi:MAG TPA: hypothetical protein VFI08_12675 [Spirochaetia bacterium]|nr:hypothetical protein [Spirochaetia bacterium]
MRKAYQGLSLAAALLFLPAAPIAAQTTTPASRVTAQVPSPLSIEVLPTFDLPVSDTASYFSYGGAADVGLKYRLPRSIFTLLGGLEYTYSPTQASTSLSMITPRVGVGEQVALTGGIAVFAYAVGGYYFATYNNFSMNATDPYLAGGLGLRFALAPNFAIEVGGQYKHYAELYQGASVGAGVDVALGNLGGSVDVHTLRLLPAFPVFYKHYDDHPIGDVTVTSNLKVPATDVRAQVYIKEFMDAPKAVAVCDTLAPGESRRVDLYALFTDKVLGITEGTKVAAEVTVSFKVEGQNYEDRKIETLSMLGRNAMTWDDNRKAAAFVTAKEPQVLNFARSVTSFVRARENRSINDNLQAAIALHEALDLYGINYTPNPVSPYTEASQHKDVIDFLQFPRETFQYKAGDCSDLSILYSALLQAVGIDAAFVTVPGHIFVAVNTGVAVEKAPDALIPAATFIPYDGKIWLPVEITMRHQGFVKAWQLGAKEWNENQLSGQAGFYPVQEAWASYQPVGLPGAESTINVPQSDRILAAYLAEVQKYIDEQLAPQVARLQDQIKSSHSLPAMNSLGVLFAKYGRADQAEAVFKQVLAARPYLPTLLNLGNLYYLKEDWSAALACYAQANEIVPNNPHVIVALAKVNQELQNYPELQKYYDKLKGIDPTLAGQYAYLGQGKESGARAADVATERRNVIWESGE